MYSWGGETSNWKKPGKYGFDSARKPYLDKLASDASSRGPRTYLSSAEPNLDLVDPQNKIITSNSENPIVIAVDVTGSMASWPGEIFDRLPLLYQTLSQYKEDLEISFAAIGDAYCDDYPLQVNDFAKGLELEDKIKALGCEGGGGGQISESYELFGHYLLNNCNVSNAQSPFLFIYGDEKFYNTVNANQVQHYIGGQMKQDTKSSDVWNKIQQKFNLYFLHKPYGYGNSDSIDKQVIEHWSKVIGPQKIIELPSCERAVDIAIGIVAKYWGQYSDFKDNLSARQDDPSIKESVYHSLRVIPENNSDYSVLSKKSIDKKTKSLSKMFDDAKK